MVRNYVRKTTPYDKEAMRAAVSLVLEGQMGYKKAAKLHDLKWQTVRDHMKKRSKKMGAGWNTALSSDEEMELATCLKLLSRWGFGMTRKETLEVVGEFISSTGRDSPFVDDLPGEDWLSGFMKRHPDLTTRHPEQLKASRAKTAANKTIVEEWLRLLKDTLTENDLLDKPDQIYNVDESGFPLDPKRLKVITQKGIPHLFRVIGGSGRDTITVQGCGRADGVMMPPYVLYSAKNLRVSWTEGGPDGSRYNVSDKGWMDLSCFHDWFCCHFIPFLSAARPVVLIFDGHASHLNPEAIKEAVKIQIIILKLPPNSTHFLQPLDVGVYGPAKTAWEAILVRFARQNLGVSLSKELFPSLLKSLWESESLCAQNVRAGFKKCGVMPLDASQISPSIYESAEFFDLLQQTPPPSSSNDSPHQPSSPTTATPSVNPAPQLSTSSSSTPAVDSAPKPSSPPTTTPSVNPAVHSAPQPSSVSPTPTQATLKDFFMLKLTPLLWKPQNENLNRKRAIKRQYGESLTSEESIARLLEDEAARKKPCKGKGKGKGNKSATTATTTADTTRSTAATASRPTSAQAESNTEDSVSDHSDSDVDPDWVPTRAHARANRNIFDNFF